MLKLSCDGGNINNFKDFNIIRNEYSEYWRKFKANREFRRHSIFLRRNSYIFSKNVRMIFDKGLLDKLFAMQLCLKLAITQILMSDK